MPTIDNSFDELEKKINKFGSSGFNDFFASNYSQQWSLLSDQEKELKIAKLRAFVESPQNKSKLEKIKEKFEHLKATEFNMGFLFLGVLLGISGNLVANLLDRYFLKFGFIYDVVVMVIFIASLWYVERTFIRKEWIKLDRDKTANRLFEIIDDFNTDKVDRLQKQT